MPLLRIEPNFDLSSTCHLPVAYQNTKVGKSFVCRSVTSTKKTYTIMFTNERNNPPIVPVCVNSLLFPRRCIVVFSFQNNYYD